MGRFGPGILLDPVTMRPVNGRVVQVTEVDSDLALTTTPAVVATNSKGYYPQFEVAGQDAVMLRGGDVDEVIAVVDRTSAGAVALAGTVASASALPATGSEPGEAYITEDTNHFWVWDGTAWVDSGSIQGPAGSDATVNDLNVATALAGDASTAEIARQVDTRPVVRSLAGNVAFLKSTTAAEHTCTIYQAGTSGVGVALNVMSDNPAESVMYLAGPVKDQGVLKIAHAGATDDGGSSAISIDLQGVGSLARGIYMTSTTNPDVTSDWFTARRTANAGGGSATARDLFAVRGSGRAVFNLPPAANPWGQVDIVGDATTGADPALSVRAEAGHTGPLVYARGGTGGGSLASFRDAAGAEKVRIGNDGAQVNYSHVYGVNGVTIGGTSNKTGGVAGLGLTEVASNPTGTVSAGAVIYAIAGELRVRIGTTNYRINLTAI